MERQNPRANSPFITHRERRILILLAEGRPNEEIARSLGVPLKRLQDHLDHLRDKFNTRSASRLIPFALKTGLINYYEVLESRFRKTKGSAISQPFHTFQGEPK